MSYNAILNLNVQFSGSVSCKEKKMTKWIYGGEEKDLDLVKRKEENKKGLDGEAKGN